MTTNMPTLNDLLTDEQRYWLMDDDRKVPRVFAIYGDWAVAEDGIYSLTEFHPLELCFVWDDSVIARDIEQLPLGRQRTFRLAVEDARMRLSQPMPTSRRRPTIESVM